METFVIDAYKYGDRIGAPWESQDYGVHDRSYNEIMRRANHYPDGTDESDIVNCFSDFTDSYTYTTKEKLLTDWLIFQNRNRRSARYGKTYEDHFRTIEWFIDNGQIDLERIYKLAQERNPGGSFGNGCLALVYPGYDYALQIKQDPISLIESFTRLVYTHDYAIRAVRFLSEIIEDLQDSKDLRDIRTDDPYVQEFLKHGLELTPDDYVIKYPDNIIALHTLFNSVYCAHNASSEQEVIVRCINFGGDVDSVLSTALMIFALIQHNQVGSGIG